MAVIVWKFPLLADPCCSAVASPARRPIGSSAGALLRRFATDEMGQVAAVDRIYREANL